jgi:hypothetical protein
MESLRDPAHVGQSPRSLSLPQILKVLIQKGLSVISVDYRREFLFKPAARIAAVLAKAGVTARSERRMVGILGIERQVRVGFAPVNSPDYLGPYSSVSLSLLSIAPGLRANIRRRKRRPLQFDLERRQE